MEPLSIQSTAATSQARPVGLQPDLSALLQDGRVLAGQVLESFGGGSILIGVGRHRVPAESQVELALGERFLFQVEAQKGGQLLLHLLGAAPSEPDLIRALRSAVGEDRPVAQLLSDLAARLRALADAGGPDASRAKLLLQELSGHVFRPGSGGEELGTLLARSGLRYEASLAAASQEALGARAGAPSVSLRGLASLWAQTLAAEHGSGEAALGELQGILVSSLQGAVLTNAAGDVPTLEVALRRLAAALRSHADGLPAGGTRSTIEAALPGLTLAQLAGQRELGLLARLLGLDAGIDPRQLAQWTAQATLAELEHDLKALLLRARGTLSEGTPAEALARALTGLEAEQLLNLARRESHDAWHWSFPVPDEDGWRTAHLFYRVGHDREGAGGSEHDGPHPHRFVLGIEMSRLGPIRAELLLQDDMLGVRVLVTRPEVAARLRTDLAELRDRIAMGDRRVHIAVVEGTEREASIEPLVSDIRYLREHPLLDLSG